MIAKKAKEKSMKTFFKNIGNTIVKKLRKHPLICNLVLSVVLAFVLEVLGRQTFDLSAVGFVDQRSKMHLYYFRNILCDTDY